MYAPIIIWSICGGLIGAIVAPVLTFAGLFLYRSMLPARVGGDEGGWGVFALLMFSPWAGSLVGVIGGAISGAARQYRALGADLRNMERWCVVAVILAPLSLLVTCLLYNSVDPCANTAERESRLWSQFALLWISPYLGLAAVASSIAVPNIYTALRQFFRADQKSLDRCYDAIYGPSRHQSDEHPNQGGPE